MEGDHRWPHPGTQAALHRLPASHELIATCVKRASVNSACSLEVRMVVRSAKKSLSSQLLCSVHVQFFVKIMEFSAQSTRISHLRTL